MSNLVHNERVKMMSQFLHNVGLAGLVAGGIGVFWFKSLPEIGLNDVSHLFGGIVVCSCFIFIGQTLLSLLKT